MGAVANNARVLHVHLVEQLEHTWRIAVCSSLSFGLLLLTRHPFFDFFFANATVVMLLLVLVLLQL